MNFSRLANNGGIDIERLHELITNDPGHHGRELGRTFKQICIIGGYIQIGVPYVFVIVDRIYQLNYLIAQFKLIFDELDIYIQYHMSIYHLVCSKNQRIIFLSANDKYYQEKMKGFVDYIVIDLQNWGPAPLLLRTPKKGKSTWAPLF